jgi:2-iminobutanoate/2-iminopropanoate deaminase
MILLPRNGKQIPNQDFIPPAGNRMGRRTVLSPKSLNNMGEKLNFNTPKAPRMSQVFPQAVIAEKFIFVSGTAGYDLHSGKVISDNFEDQTRQCFQNIKVILEEAGSSMSNVVKTTIFMVTGNDFSVINKVYGEFFPENPPARSTPQVMPFPAGILISVECIALQSP